LERLTAILQVALLVEIVHPGHPALHVLLCARGCPHCVLPSGFRHPIDINKMAHISAPLMPHCRSVSSRHMTFEPATAGHLPWMNGPLLKLSHKYDDNLTIFAPER